MAPVWHRTSYPGCMTAARPSIPPVVDTVPAGARLVDIRWALDGSKDRSTYLAGHLPGAVYVDLGTDLAGPASREEGRHPLPAPVVFAAAMARAGISDGDTVIAYDDSDGSQASRLVWMLRALGEEAALLDGGLRAQVAAGAELAIDDVRPPGGAFTPRPWGSDVIAMPDEAALGAALVIDARAAERYRGETEPIDPRAGHIPGAHSVPFAGNVDADGRFLPPAALRERFAAVGADEAADVIVYCGSGVTATFDLLALERAGLAGRLLPGSWSQWSADPSRPVATGPQP